MKKAIHFLALILISFSVFGQNGKRDRYEIYGLILTDLIEEYEEKRIVIVRRTSLWDIKIEESDSLYFLTKKLIVNNRRRICLRNRIKPRNQIDFISGLRLKWMFLFDIEKGWQRFYEKNPNSLGIIELSKIAYSDDGESCLVYLEHMKGSRSGAGYLLLVDLTNNKVTRYKRLWIA